MLLPALSRLVGVISHHGGYRGNPIPITREEISESACVDKPRLSGGSSSPIGTKPFIDAKRTSFGVRA
jgi:hypothetical protein